MEKQNFPEVIQYRGEDYTVLVGKYLDDSGDLYTTTESDQDWWEDLRTQYIARHPEALQDFILSFPGDWIKETPEGLWEATWIDYDLYYIEVRKGDTKEEALKNLYICLAV